MFFFFFFFFFKANVLQSSRTLGGPGVKVVVSAIFHASVVQPRSRERARGVMLEGRRQAGST